MKIFDRLGAIVAAVLLTWISACVPSQPPASETTPNANGQSQSEAPAVEAPVVEAPVVEAPVVEAPAVEAPVVEAPAVEAPAVEAPAVEAPAVEAPAVEEPAALPKSEPEVTEPAEESTFDPYMPTMPGPTSNVGENGLMIPATPEAQKGAYRIDVISRTPEEGGGADVEGAFHLRATLRWTDGQWLFKGELTFPTGGYTLGEIGHEDFGGEGAGKDMSVIFIPVALPPLDAVVSQALDKRTLEYSFEGPEDASFVVAYSQL
jgi:hypothetical protein